MSPSKPQVMLPTMSPVASSRIAEIGYNEKAHDLFVRFVRGALYVYREVPPSVMQRIMGGPSIGKNLTMLVERKGYVYQRLEG